MLVCPSTCDTATEAKRGVLLRSDFCAIPIYICDVFVSVCVYVPNLSYARWMDKRYTIYMYTANIYSCNVFVRFEKRQQVRAVCVCVCVFARVRGTRRVEAGEVSRCCLSTVCIIPYIVYVPENRM